MSIRRKDIHHANKKAFLAELRAGFPPFFEAVDADARRSAVYRGEPQPTSKLESIVLAFRLMWESDAFFALVLYRARTTLQRRGVPVIPRLLHKWCMSSAQLCIGDPVHIDAGVYVPHGQLVIDGITRIGTGAVLAPWGSIGLRSGDFRGPVIGTNVHVGTGSRILGPLTVGNDAQIGASSVVIHDVPAGAIVVGQPAREIKRVPSSP